MSYLTAAATCPETKLLIISWILETKLNSEISICLTKEAYELASSWMGSEGLMCSYT